MSRNLSELPPEVLNQIVTHFDAVNVLLRLSLTCRRLHGYVQVNGYRIFVQTNFRFTDSRAPWREAAHSLTTATKCWQRRSLQASYLSPELDIAYLPYRSDPARRQRPQPSYPKRQSMGFQAQIDCIETWIGGTWDTRKEILAIGAGAELRVRIRSMGAEVEKCYYAASEEERGFKYDLLHHRKQEIVWKGNDYLDGRDDIVSLNLLRRHDRPINNRCHLIIGRASGVLERVSISLSPGAENGEDVQIADDGAVIVEGADLPTEAVSGPVATTRYDTGMRPVRCTHVNSSKSPLLAACLADCIIALYSADSAPESSSPLSKITFTTPKDSSRIWTSRFLTPTRLALGRGPSTVPLSIHDVTPTGLHPIPLQAFASASSSSVYAISPLPSSSHLLLSGWYNGEIRLHDQRQRESSLSAAAATFVDPLDSTSPIYSLLPRGTDRFIAGSARHALIKVFDLRMPGIMRYSTPETTIKGAKETDDSFNLFIRYREQLPNPMNSQHPHLLHPASPGQQLFSPIYSLASASAFSPTFYAGLEQQIVQFRQVDPMDRWPDMEFKHVKEARGSLKEWWGWGLCGSRNRLQVNKEALEMERMVLGLVEYGGGGASWASRGGDGDGDGDGEGETISVQRGGVKLFYLDEAGDAVKTAVDGINISNGSDASTDRSNPASGHGWLDSRWTVEGKPTQRQTAIRRGEGRGRGMSWARYRGRRGNRYG